MADRRPSPWPPMLWVGGTPGSGKSRLAWRLAHEHDLLLVPVDAYRSGAGHERVARGLPLVIDEIRAREPGDVTTVVEGEELEPDLATALPPGHAVWLVATPERARRVREERGARSRTSTDDARLQGLVAADAAHGQHLRGRAHELNQPVVEVPLQPDWDALLAACRDALRPGLDRARRLEPGRPLRAARRWENDAAHRQLVAHEEALELVTPRRFSFACVCGRSSCAAVWEGRPEEYATASAAGTVTAAAHR